MSVAKYFLNSAPTYKLNDELISDIDDYTLFEQAQNEHTLQELKTLHYNQLLQNLKHLIEVGNFIVVNQFLSFENPEASKQIISDVLNDAEKNVFITFLKANPVLTKNQRVALQGFVTNHLNEVLTVNRVREIHSIIKTSDTNITKAIGVVNKMLSYEVSVPLSFNGDATKLSALPSLNKNQASVIEPQNTQSNSKVNIQTNPSTKITQLSTFGRLQGLIFKPSVVATPVPAVTIQEPSDFEKLVKALKDRNITAIYEITNNKNIDIEGLRNKINDTDNNGNTVMHLIMKNIDTYSYNLKELKEWCSLFNLVIGVLKPDLTATDRSGKTIQNCQFMNAIQKSLSSSSLNEDNKKYLKWLTETVDEAIKPEETSQETSTPVMGCSQ